MEKINVLGGKVTLGGDVVPASDTLTSSVRLAAEVNYTLRQLEGLWNDYGDETPENASRCMEVAGRLIEALAEYRASLDHP